MNARNVLLESFQEICKDKKDQPLIEAIESVLQEEVPIPPARLLEGLQWAMQYFCEENKEQKFIDNIDQALQTVHAQMDKKKGSSLHLGRQY